MRNFSGSIQRFICHFYYMWDFVHSDLPLEYWSCLRSQTTGLVTLKQPGVALNTWSVHFCSLCKVVRLASGTIVVLITRRCDQASRRRTDGHEEEMLWCHAAAFDYKLKDADTVIDVGYFGSWLSADRIKCCDGAKGKAPAAGRRRLRSTAKGAITSKIRHAIKHKTSPARLAQLL